jgi:predicted polyphosphate/ATP-dependent NAD kinase
MTTVGIIANPASGKDIRRLVAHGSVFDNEEKVNIVRRVLLGLDAVGVERALCMPDSYAIARRAQQRIHPRLSVELVDMEPNFNQNDSTRAARHMVAAGVGAIVTLGGDGTNRAVSKGCGEVPLVAISTGTNNVFPTMIEGTLAGMAAGLVAAGKVRGAPAIARCTRLEVLRDGQVIDTALVDAAVYDDLFIGARAVWDMRRVHAIVLARPARGIIGLSSVGAAIPSVDGAAGLFIRTGEGGQRVVAPIAPGVVAQVEIASWQALLVGESVPVEHAPAVIALDGEREVSVKPGEQLHIRLSDRGPYLVDVSVALAEAARAGLFVR